MPFSVSTILVGAVLLLIQLLAALPWMALAFQSREQAQALAAGVSGLWASVLDRQFLTRALIAVAACFVIPVVFLVFVQDRAALEISGRLFASVLQIQLTLDAFILGFAVLLRLWPKGGAVALAAFREGVRQPMFWLLVLFAAMLMAVSIFVPYFTFGEDYLMVKQLGYDTIMLAAVLFGALAASLSIAEEIEGRTAVTLMSKPISRRQFLLGKYVGIILAAVFMFGMLGAYFEGVLLAKHWWDKLTPITELAEQTKESTSAGYVGVVPTPAWVAGALKFADLPSAASDFLRGIGQWAAHTADTLPGLILSFSQVMVLVALAVTLATRVPAVVNLVTVLVVYFAAHLTPVLLAISRRQQALDPNSPVPRLIGFVSQVFDTVLPDLGAFRMDPALLSDAPPPAELFTRYVASVTLYGVLYTVIVLLLGLILFEDRDLA